MRAVDLLSESAGKGTLTASQLQTLRDGPDFQALGGAEAKDAR
jgi:hypothetical protein